MGEVPEKELSEEEKTVAAVTRIVLFIGSKKGILSILLVTFVGIGGTGFTANLAALSAGPPQTVEISSPQMQSMIEENILPVQELVGVQASELQLQAVQLMGIEQTLLRAETRDEKAEMRSNRIEEQLLKNTEAVSQLAGQLEIVVELEMRRLGIPQ